MKPNITKVSRYTEGNTLTIKQLGKQYGQHCALKDVSFDIRPGKIVALLGIKGRGCGLKNKNLKQLGILLANSTIYLVAGLFTFSKLEKIAKKRNLIGQY